MDRVRITEHVYGARNVTIRDEIAEQVIVKILSAGELAKRIDHAVLKPSATRRELEQAIEELESLNLRCLIVTPTLAPEARSMTKNCIGAVAGFPHGYHPLEAKLKEVEEIAALGIDEIDYVMNNQWLIMGYLEKYKAEARAVATLCRQLGVKCKLIIETPILDKAEIIEKAVAAILEAASEGIDYIKTSTGFAPRPTYPEDIIVIKNVIRGRRSHVGVKAAGGIRTAIQALLMLAMGADIIGTSKPTGILSGLQVIKRYITD